VVFLRGKRAPSMHCRWINKVREQSQPRGIREAVLGYIQKPQADGVGVAMYLYHPPTQFPIHKLGDVTSPPELCAGGHLPFSGGPSRPK